MRLPNQPSFGILGADYPPLGGPKESTKLGGNKTAHPEHGQTADANSNMSAAACSPAG